MSADKRQTLYHQLKNKWTQKHRDLQFALWQKHKESIDWLTNNTKQFAVGALSGAVLLASPSANIASPQPQATLSATPNPTPTPTPPIDKKTFLIEDLYNVLPKDVRPLTASEEDTVVQTLTRHFNVEVRAEISGIRLNRSYGYIGQEQHLARYPGDNMLTHFNNQKDADRYFSYGMAPGLGAYGYFAKSQQDLTQKDSEREKYYIAVPTFLSPGYGEHSKEYNDFFKFHKMIVVNPNNGHALVADIGDSGPASWTGKHLGGSPEVMQYLERVDGGGKGPVLYFFINDPNDTIPLGPIVEK